MSDDRPDPSPADGGDILRDPAVRRLRHRLSALLDELLTHDGWGRLELDMRILTRRQKEFIVRCGREWRFVVDFRNTAADAAGSCHESRCPLRERDRT